jgi:SAM-dependent methyltransferase
MAVLEELCPGWRDAVLHESSPSGRGPSGRFYKECPRFIPSHYWGPQNPGEPVEGVRNENLEALTFEDASIDIHVTQDVFEHLFDIDGAAREIARTLRPGGMHVFTTPLVRKYEATIQRARRSAGRIEHLLPPEYHGNPIDSSGSLVVWHFGYDLADRIQLASGMTSTVYVIDNLDLGIRAEYIEVIVSRRRD